jgi:GTPase SAR1 family protein
MNLVDYAVISAGFNVETVEYKNISFTVWDVGGQDKVYINEYVTPADALILVSLLAGEIVPTHCARR